MLNIGRDKPADKEPGLARGITSSRSIRNFNTCKIRIFGKDKIIWKLNIIHMYVFVQISLQNFWNFTIRKFSV